MNRVNTNRTLNKLMSFFIFFPPDLSGTGPGSSWSFFTKDFKGTEKLKSNKQDYLYDWLRLHHTIILCGKLSREIKSEKGRDKIIVIRIGGGSPLLLPLPFTLTAFFFLL
jgi:hypothetical protein